MSSEIKYLKSFISRRTCFGTLFSDIEWNGKIVSPREGTNGFFYNIQTPFGNFNKGSDLHISIFDNSGFAKAHVTFKPYPNEILSFHYGFKLNTSLFEEFWVTGMNPYNQKTTEQIYNDIIQVYYSVLEKIFVNRPDLSPYPLKRLGTTGRVRNENQEQFVLDEYQRQGRTPPSYVFKKKIDTPSSSLKPTGAVKKKRVSEFFKKGPLFNG